MPFSHHSHSGQFCAHAKDTLEDVVKAALAKKMHLLALTEHMPREQRDLYPEEVGIPTSRRNQAELIEVDRRRLLREGSPGHFSPVL